MSLVGSENLFCLGVPIPHGQLRGEGDGLTDVGAVVELMEFHRLNLGFLAYKELRGRRD